MPTINPYSALTNVGAASTDRAAIAQDFDTFLTLLTTQLQNQDPLDPLDTNEFTQQLVQFTEVEQTIKTNQNLENLAQLSAANTITGAVSYIGKEISASGNTAELSTSEAATWQFNAAAKSPEATFTIKDSSGNEIYSEKKAVDAGEGTFTWNGNTTDGGTAPAGTYTLSITGIDGQGGSVQINTTSSGTVTGVDMSGSELLLEVNGKKIKLTDILSIAQPKPESETTSE